jgi:hypothetical protein
MSYKNQKKDKNYNQTHYKIQKIVRRPQYSHLFRLFKNVNDEGLAPGNTIGTQALLVAIRVSRFLFNDGAEKMR